ncbi:ROK family protein [Allocatelliglobosispora scoriae]|nr:ROK family protein [Allocatelliglobosispora scoriae]
MRHADHPTSEQLVLAVDIGGTKLAACLAGPDGLIGEPVSTPTPKGDGEEVFAALAGIIGKALDGRRVDGIGIGAAGPLELKSGTLSPVNISGWRSFPIVERVSDLVPNVPVVLAGDGNCAAAGEHWLGAGRGHDDLLVLVVSTGVGGGLIIGGRLMHGPTANAGHLGHVVVDLHGDRCPCGGIGCVESIASGPSMAKWALRNGWRPDGPPTAITLDIAARGGDRIAMQAFERAGQAIAAGIVTAAALCDVDRAIIGGGVARAGDLLFDPVRRYLRDYAKLEFLQRLNVVPAELGTNAGLAGAAALVLEPGRYAP